MLTPEELNRIELDRKQYCELSSNQSNLLDKSIISISGASFTIAIGFINKLIPMEYAEFQIIFWISLIFLAATILTTVFSFSCSENAANKMREACDNAEVNQDYSILENAKTFWNNLLDIANIARIICFFFGISFLAFFIGYNGIMGTHLNQTMKERYMESASYSCCCAPKAKPSESQHSYPSQKIGVVPPSPRPRPTPPQGPGSQPPIKK